MNKAERGENKEHNALVRGRAERTMPTNQENMNALAAQGHDIFVAALQKRYAMPKTVSRPLNPDVARVTLGAHVNRK